MNRTIIVAGLAAAAIGATVVASVFMIGEAAEARACTAKGGQLVSRSNTNVGTNTKGEVVMTSSEGKVCVNAAGHVLQ